MNLTKCNRFIKDPAELERVNQVLLKYYRALRDQFFAQASNPDSYPSIDWLDFTNTITRWKVIDRFTLKMADADRIFIATNVELED